VKDFQREKGLAADGLVGPDTRAAIRKALPLGPTFGEIWSAALGWLKRRFSPR
jgi:peptidoglycan hydrolase-like protein with peptidoglycan-binding domain